MNDLDWGGPYVQIAAFCEQVIEDRTGTLSLIRVVDRITVTHVSVGDKSVPDPEPKRQELTLVVVLKPGTAIGTYPMTIQREEPSGVISSPLVEFTVHFEGADRGANVLIPLEISTASQGLTWYHIRIDGKLVSKVPMSVITQRHRSPLPSEQA